MESGISAYFTQDKIRLRFKTLVDLNYPEYIHFLVNEKKKHMFIEKCERDMNSIRIVYKKGCGAKINLETGATTGTSKIIREQSVYVHEKRILDYLAKVIGVPRNSPSLRFTGQLQDDGRVFIDLNEYSVITYKKTIAENPDVQE